MIICVNPGLRNGQFRAASVLSGISTVEGSINRPILLRKKEVTVDARE